MENMSSKLNTVAVDSRHAGAGPIALAMRLWSGGTANVDICVGGDIPRSSFGNLAKFTTSRHASSRVSSFADEMRDEHTRRVLGN